MISLLVLVLLVVVFSRAISIIGKDTICDALWSLYLRIAPPSPTLRTLRAKQTRARQVHAERAATSAKDEFARWAKLDREAGKLRTEIDVLQSSLVSSKTSFNGVLKVTLFALTTGAKLWLRFWYRKTPVFWVPPGVWPSYVYWFLAFSSAPRGSVSVSSWLFVVDWSVSLIEYLVTDIYKEFIITSKDSSSATSESESKTKQPEVPKSSEKIEEIKN
ncbi:uncharacterized protein SAPINGB_P004139 [Magnusiomyces paraingens]|uniref:Golgi to ER traffic protein 1 n=1 Tax=Magnusiomyces paraingens TaxID=2606893 RepID=A0A5E8C0E1_9ASCO|nr:uncharacterized protein SAPINGB_P004139 [Saprochaete ingens]VVT54565.1 unnamed protein product [Saprochaete ingens]